MGHKRLPLYKGEDQTDKYFGKWKVLEFVEFDNKNYKHKWKCLCTGCNREFIVFSGNLTSAKSKSCKSCHDYSGENNGNWKGHKEIPAYFWYRLNFGAKQRNIDVKITIEDIQDLWEKSDKKCNLSGLPIEIGKTASVDRVDSKKPYEKGNIQFVHKLINRIKIDLSQDKFLELCALISNHKKEEIEKYINYYKSIPNYQLMLDD